MNQDRAGHLAIRLVLEENVERKKFNWSDLTKFEASALDKVMNSGIPREEVELTRATFNNRRVTVAQYADAGEDFYAEYLMDGSDVIFCYEN